MSSEKYANLASTTLSAAIADGTVTSITVTSAALFPSSGQFRIKIDSEILLVTTVSGTTWTVTRGVEGTTAAAHTNASTVTHILTKGGLDQVIADNCQLGTYGNRPAAEKAGRLYIATDTAAIYRDNGSSWDKIGYSIIDRTGQALEPVPVRGDCIFLMCGFIDYNGTVGASSEQQLRFYVSLDGLSWNSLTPYTHYNDPNIAVGGFFRDPSIIFYKGAWYIVYTNNFMNSVVIPQFSIARSYDLINWTHLGEISISAISGWYNAWAPEWFIDTDDTLHVFIAVSIGSPTTNFQIYETHPLNDNWLTPCVAISGITESGTTATATTTTNHGFSVGQSVIITGVNNANYNGTFTIASVPTSTTFTFTAASSAGSGSGGQCNINYWSTPVKITGTSFPADVIDPYVVKTGGTYYLFMKNQDANANLMVYSSTSLTSGYTILNGNVTPNGQNMEGACVLQIDSTTWRLYADQRTDQGMRYMESTNLFVSWGSINSLVRSPGIWNHGTIIRITDGAAIRQLLGAHISASLPEGAFVQKTTSQTAANNTATQLVLDTVVNDDGGFSNLGTHNTRLTATASGWYILHAEVQWTPAGSGEFVLDIKLTRNGSGTVLFLGDNRIGINTSVTPSALSTSLPFYLGVGDFIEASVYQNSGGTLTIPQVQLSMVRMGGY